MSEILVSKKVAMENARRKSFTIRHETPPERCEICHQADLFDPTTGECQRCTSVIVTFTPNNLQKRRSHRSIDALNNPLVPKRFRDALFQEIGDEPVLWAETEKTKRLTGIHSEGIPWSLILYVASLNIIPFFSYLTESWLHIFTTAGSISFVFLAVLSLLHTMRRRLYVITPRHALILELSQPTQRFSARELASLKRISEKGGVGDLIFEEEFQFKNGSLEPIRNGFFGIKRVHEVEQLIRDHILNAPGQPRLPT